MLNSTKHQQISIPMNKNESHANLTDIIVLKMITALKIKAFEQSRSHWAQKSLIIKFTKMPNKCFQY